VAWQSTTNTSSCESGSEGLASTICHDRNGYATPLDAGRVHYYIRFLFALIRTGSIRCNCPPKCSYGPW
jgi:hypothetical protein